VAPGEALRVAAARAVQWKDPPRKPPLVVPLEKVRKGWKNQVGQTIEKKVVSKLKKS